MTKLAKNIIKFCVVLLIISAPLLLPAAASAATLYFSPSSGSYEVGKTFNVTVYVSSAEQAMNAVSGAISFPADKLEAVSIVKTGSVISLWVQEPSFSQGAVNFEGIVLNPGFTGAAGKIITMNFKAKQAGSAPLVFSSGAILANDGQGTNILTGMGGGNYEISLKIITPPAEEKPAPTLPSSAEEKTEAKEAISKPEITSPTHPDQAAWYNNNDVKFNWELPYGITGISILLNDKPDSNPGPVSDGLFSTKEYQDLEDGIWYLHLKFKNKSGWTEIDHFKVQIDTTPPLPPCEHYTDFTIEPIEPSAVEIPAAESYPREPKISKAVAPVFAKIGNRSISYPAVFVVLLIFTILIILCLLLLAGSIKRKTKKEVDEAEEVLHNNLKDFKNSIERELTLWDKFGDKEGYDKEKVRIIQSLKKKIDFMENKILKEIKDIENLLK